MTNDYLLELPDDTGPTERAAAVALCGYHKPIGFGACKGRPFMDINMSYLLWLATGCDSISDRQRATVSQLID